MNVSRRLIINCGASKVTAAEISIDEEDLQIDRLVTVDLVYDFSNEEEILPSIGEALKELNEDYDFSGVATLIIPGNLVLTRTIQIPYIEESKRAQIIAFEAQQNLPYSLNEVVWDSQIVKEDGVEIEALFIAARTHTINDLCSYMRAANFEAEKISAATVLDYNALKFAYPDLKSDVLLINIGARSTNLLFGNSEGFFVRNIQLGGNSLTQSIADGMGKKFPVAEKIKHKFFNEVENSDNDDARAKQLNTCADAFIRRMSQEITLSIVNYKRQNGGIPPDRILLNGRGSLLKGLSEKLSRTQKIEVDFFDPLKKVTLEGSIETEMEILVLQTSEIIGEACCDIVDKPSKVNLLPETVQTEMAFSRRKPFIMVAAACFVLGLLPPWLSFKQANAFYADQVNNIQNDLEPLRQRQDQIRDYRESAETASESINRLEGLINSRSNWIRFFADLQKSLNQAEDVWIDKLNVIRNLETAEKASYEVVIEGRLLVREAVNGLDNIDEKVLSDQIKSLRNNFEDSEFIVSSRSPVITFTNLHNGLYVLPFSINLVVDPAKPL